MGHAADLAGTVCGLLGSRLATRACADGDGAAGLELWFVGIRQSVGLFAGPLVVDVCAVFCFHKMLANSIQTLALIWRFC